MVVGFVAYDNAPFSSARCALGRRTRHCFAGPCNHRAHVLQLYCMYCQCTANTLPVPQTVPRMYCLHRHPYRSTLEAISELKHQFRRLLWEAGFVG